MANLNLYINGTPGGTDGILATSDTFIIDGIMFPYHGHSDRGFSIIPLSLRCNPGTSAQGVKVTTPEPQYFTILCADGVATFTSPTAMYGRGYWAGSWTSNGFTNTPFYNGITVGSTNISFLLLAKGVSGLSVGLRDVLMLSFIE